MFGLGQRIELVCRLERLGGRHAPPQRAPRTGPPRQRGELRGRCGPPLAPTVKVMKRDPVIDRWLRAGPLGDRGVHLDADQLAGLTMVTQVGDEVPACPDEVLQAWYTTITAQRRIVDQAEAAFIPMARRNSWSWERIAE